MARIAGIDLPRDKRIEIGLTYIYGIGRKSATDILAATGINPDTRVRDLTEEDASKLREYIEKNYRTATLTSVAAHFNLNPDYLSRLLKKQTGSSFQTLLTRQRMITAQLLLRSSTSPIRQIAAEIGYENVSFFYQKFREAFHLSPGEYRAGFPDCTDFPFSPPDSRHNP